MGNVVNSVENISELRSIHGTFYGETVEVLGYYIVNDGGGGVFLWDDTATQSDDGGTVIESNIGGIGRWLRVMNGIVDVRWFGAKGNYLSPSNIGQDDTVFLQAACDYVASNNLDLYFSKGKYRVTSAIILDFGTLTGRSRCNVFGDGAYESEMIHEASGTGILMFEIRSIHCFPMTLKDFAVRQGFPNNGRVSTGLKLAGLSLFSLENILINELDTGILLSDTMMCKLSNVYIIGNRIGLHGEVNNTSPNLINFVSCNFMNNSFLAIMLMNMHSVSFHSCDISNNGTQGDMDSGGMYCSFYGGNGSNGLNMYNCYVEANLGGADVKIDNFYGQGTHNFIGNTFNRGATSDHIDVDTGLNFPNAYTVNNILLQAINTHTHPHIKSKINVQGNGFFYADWKYTPDSNRKNILLNPASFSGFDIIDQGNVYMSHLEKPVFDSAVFQISEHTRVKGFCTYNYNTLNIDSSYNVSSVAVLGTGNYQVFFSNELERNPVVNITPIDSGTPVFGYLTSVSTQDIIVSIVNVSGTPTNASFNITLH